MKKIFLISVFCKMILLSFGQQQLNGVTYGIGIGWSVLTKHPNDYYLTTDNEHLLKSQQLGRSSAVISSTVTVKFGKISSYNNGNRNMLVSTARTMSAAPSTNPPNYPSASFTDRLAFNLSLNIAEIKNGDIAFNSAIDGGIGLGCFINEFTQVAVFYDLKRIRQMRDDIVLAYLNKGIPNGNEIFNALDDSNNNLFYNRYFSGFSLKMIFSFGNK